MTAFGEYVVRGFSHLMELPLSFHKKHKMGEISDRIQRAASWLDSIISNVAVNLVAQLLGILIAFIIIFSIKPFLASVLFGAALIYVLILSRITPELTILKRKEHRAWNRAYGDAFDAVLNTQSVKQATAEKHEEKKTFQKFLFKRNKILAGFLENLAENQPFSAFDCQLDSIGDFFNFDFFNLERRNDYRSIGDV